MAEKPNDPYVATMTAHHQGQSVLILTADNVQDLEFFYPYYRFVEEGYHVEVVTPKGGKFEGKKGMGLQQTKAIDAVSPENYALLYIPGGQAPAALKKDKKALELVRHFAHSGKPIAAICHGSQLLAEAGLIQGRNITAWPEVEKEVSNAGAHYCNEPVVVDGQFITARWPGDLPAHLAHALEALQHSKAQPQARRVASGS